LQQSIVAAGFASALILLWSILLWSIAGAGAGAGAGWG